VADVNRIHEMEKPVNLFDQYSRRYDEWYDKHTFAYQSELAIIREVLPREGKGLEIGAGTGRFSAPLGITVGIDPSRPMLEMARQRGVMVCQSLGEDLPFRDSTFDYIAVIIALCFVKDPLKALQEMWRVVKSKGKIIIGIIDRDSFLGEFYLRKESIFYKQAHLFKVGELTGLLEKSGFDRFSYHQTLFTMPDKMDAVQKAKKGFAEGGFVVIQARRP